MVGRLEDLYANAVQTRKGCVMESEQPSRGGSAIPTGSRSTFIKREIL